MRKSRFDVERMVALREKGWGCKQLADEFECSQGAVNYHLMKHGALPPRLEPKLFKPRDTYNRNGYSVRAFTPEEDRRITEMRNKGMGVTAIGQILGRKHNAVAHRLNALARVENYRKDV